MEPRTTYQVVAQSALYRRVWRWHFYAGLVCLPFLALMAATGALYLYKDSIEGLVYAQLRTAPDGPGAALSPETLVAKAVQALPGQPVRFNPPPTEGRSAEVGVRTGDGVVGVYLDPSTGRVLGTLPDSRRLMEVVKNLHSLMIVGKWANYWVEIVAGWAIVLVVSGVFLWWPRGRQGGVVSVRGRPAQRTWWRDLHAVTGAVAGSAILFLAVTGMPWSAFWGQQFGAITGKLGIGLPQYLFGPGPASSAPPSAGAAPLPWLIAQAPVPQSALPDAGHAGHAGHGAHSAPEATDPSGESERASIGLDKALQIFKGMGLPSGTPVMLPAGPRGTYSAVLFPDDVRSQRVVHLDRYSGAVLSDVGYANYGVAGRTIEWGINIHTGQQFGWINQLVMLAACLSIITLALTAVTMWWKRRPRGRLAAPAKREGDRAAAGALAVAALLGIAYPLLGASMLVALIVDVVIPKHWHERFGL
ncbi:PepSY domain-containing protein [Variovorax dokdonensis]|uniref:PepSY domain-containing protein n=1 Tax=Variovorax dokdonensis TaxID=344883 RepID=A0ABT7NF51_9BURK|nr:PepSY domain-containing protein [Variovorax dokdonensis]MDM0046574.1 PepSY domain-containing protein [Variovorax dokdonensis]